MIRALVEKLAGRRWVFVVGKGGVGKTTAAGALALALADEGESTHLISSDPAHSLADLFDAPALSSPRASPCTDLLVLEELDADAYGARWRRENAAGLGELLERGTYLDAEDVAGFLRLSLPGADEIMAALRLAELDEGSARRIVVDTAPAGHTLRLLDAGATLAGWTSAFDAMRAKADAVAGALTGRSASVAGAAALARLDADVRRFETRVIGSAAFVLVSREEPVVRAETRSLRAELRRRGVTQLIELGIGQADRQVDVVAAPWLPGIQGCEGLRAYFGNYSSHGGRGARRSDRADSATFTARLGAPVADLLCGPRVLFFAGKGGVGKSTCAAAAALGTGRVADPVRVYSTDPAGSLGGVLQTDVGHDPVEVAPGVRAEQVDAAAALATFRHHYLQEIENLLDSLGVGSSGTLDRRVLEALRDLVPPGMDEIFAVASLAETEGRVIVDSAPTGHFLRLLEMPELGLGWLHALMRIVLRYGHGPSLEATGNRLLAAAARLKWLRDALHGGEAGVVLVTLEEPMVAAETLRLHERLRAGGVPVLAWLVNRARGDASRSPTLRPHDAGVHVLEAPELRPAPLGPVALLDFFRQWRLA